MCNNDSVVSNILFPDAPPLHHDLQRSLQAATTMGTKANRLNQAKLYLKFMFSCEYDPYNPSKHQLQLYSQFLANSFKSTQSIKNYIAGAKTFLHSRGIPTLNFSDPTMHQTIKGIDNLSTHIPKQAPELLLSEIKLISSHLHNYGPLMSGERACFLIMYSSFIRQSNSLSIRGTEHHTVLTCDFNIDNNVLWIDICSSKSIRNPRHAVSIPVYPAPGRHCPVEAWTCHINLVPRLPQAPAFLSVSGQPINSHYLLKIIRSVLQSISSPNAMSFTLHSMRRSGSRQAARGGAPVEDVMSHGTWSSSSVFSYVPRRLFSSVPKTISSSLALKN